MLVFEAGSGSTIGLPGGKKAVAVLAKVILSTLSAFTLALISILITPDPAGISPVISISPVPPATLVVAPPVTVAVHIAPASRFAGITSLINTPVALLGPSLTIRKL
ncbi:hypothetical protein D3C85_1051590 [compost metagenome]